MFFIERTMRQRHRLTRINQDDESPVLSGNGLLLKVLTHSDANAFFDLYSCLDMHNASWSPTIKARETQERFAERIVSACEMIWTIRLAESPDAIIGDCALHHWNRPTNEMELGGSLLPAFWGHGIMATAFPLVSAFAKNVYGVNTLKCTTSIANHRAIRFAEKMGFKRLTGSKSAITFSKEL